MNVMIITFLCKMADNALSTLKNIYLHKKNYFLSSFFSALGTFFYMVAIVNTIKDNSFGSIIMLCIATFLGSYLPGKYVESREDDKLYVFEITTIDFEEGLEFVRMLRDDMHMAIKSAPAFNNDGKKVIECKVYCSTKQESAMVKDLIRDGYKYHAYEAQDC